MADFTCAILRLKSSFSNYIKIIQLNIIFELHEFFHFIGEVIGLVFRIGFGRIPVTQGVIGFVLYYQLLSLKTRTSAVFCAKGIDSKQVGFLDKVLSNQSLKIVRSRCLRKINLKIFNYSELLKLNKYFHNGLTILPVKWSW